MTNYSKTVKINGEFDAKQILDELKKIESEMSKVIPSKQQPDLAKVSKSLEKVLDTAQQLNNQTKEGFKNDKEVNNFINGIEKVDQTAKTVVTDLEKINTLSQNIWDEALKKSKDDLEKGIDRKISRLSTSIKKIIDGSTVKIPEKSILSQLQNLDPTGQWQKGYAEAWEALQKYIAAQKEQLTNAKEELKIAKLLEQLKGKYKKDKNYTGTEYGALIRNKDGSLISNADVYIKEAFERTLRSLPLETRSSASSLSTAMSSFWTSFGLTQPKIDYVSAFQGDNAEIRNIENILKGLSQNEVAQLFQNISQTVSSTSKEIDEFRKRTRATQATIIDNNEALREQGAQFQAVRAGINEASGQWSTYASALQNAVRNQSQLDSGFATLLNRIKYFLSFTTLFTQLRRQITQTFKDVRELDKSFAEIAMVTRYSVDQMWGSYQRYAEMANELGQATNDVVQASALYYQQGLDTNEVLSLTENTMKLATLASIDFSEATDLMTAALRGFKLEMTEGSHITDVYSELAAHAAANVQEIAVAMNKTAAIANSAGMSFENTAAFLTQMIEATQETASNIGTAMKTVIARFTELKENVDDLDEDFEDLEYNKIDKALKSVGVELKDQNRQFRNLDDVFIELSSHWQNLTRNQQRYIATTAAGSRQQSRFIAMIDNYARTMELIDTASDSEGRSSQQFEKYADSVEYSIKKLQNTWEQLRVGLLNSDFYKGLTETANNFLNRISDFNAWDWSKLLLMFTTLGRMSMNAFFNGTQQALGSVRNALQQSLLTLPNQVRNYTPVQRIITGARVTLGDRWQQRQYTKIDNRIAELERQQTYLYRQGVNQPHLATQANERIDRIETQLRPLRTNRDALSNYMNEDRATQRASRFTPEARLANLTAVASSAGAAFTTAFTTSMLTDDPGAVLKNTLISGAISAVPSVINTFTTAFAHNDGNIGKAFGSALQGGIMAIAATAAIALVSALAKQIEKQIKIQQERNLRETNAAYDAAKKLEELQEIEQEIGKQARKTAQDAELSADAYEKLSSKGQKLEELKRKVVLTTEEEEELVSVSNELAEIAPSLVSYYDAEGNAVIDLANKYEELLEKKKEAANWDAYYADQKATELEWVKVEQEILKKEHQVSTSENKTDKNLQKFFTNPLGYTNFTGIALHGLETSLSVAANPFIGPSTYNALLEKKYYLNDAEKAAVGQAAKIVLGDVTEFAGALSGSDVDVVDNIQQLIEESAESDRLLKLMNEALEKFTPDLQSLDYNIESAISSAISLQKTTASDSLKTISAFYGDQSDKNIQDIMLAYALGENFSEADLKRNFKIEKGMNAEDNFDAFSEWVQEQFDKIDLDKVNLEAVFTDSVIKVLSQIKDLKLNYPQLEDYLRQNLSPNVFQAWLASVEPQRNAYNTKLERNVELVGGYVDKSSGFWRARGPMANLAEGLANVDANLFYEKLINWDNVGRKDKFLAMFKDISAADINEIFQFDWGKISKKNYEEQIKALEEVVSVERPALEKILEKTGLIDFAARSLGEFKEGIEQDIKDFKNFDKAISAVQTAGTSWAKDGKVSVAGIEAMVDAGLDVSKIVSEDLTFNLKEAEKQLDTQLNLELDSLDAKLKANQALLQQLSIMKLITEEVKQEQLLALGLSEDVINQYFIKGKNGLFTKSPTFEAEYEAIQELVNKQDEETKVYRALIEARALEKKSAIQSIEKELEESKEKEVKAQKEVADAYDNVLKKQQELIDKQKELNEVLYGKDFHKNKLDELYNYTTALDVYTDAIKEAKDELDNLEGRSPTEFIDEWFGGTHNQAANLAATNTRYETAIRNTQNVLTNRLADYLRGAGMSNNVSDFFYYDSSLDRYGINYGALNGASMNDSLRDFIEEQVDLMNQYKKNIKKNQDELKNLEKEFKDYQKKARDNYISVQEEIAKKLEEFYKKQVDDKKEMYDALEEADNEYLDALQKAIDKQRKLRDKENRWNDLALKEKKLSLMQRDTSGANQRTVQSLRKEIDKDRQSMLDNAVDTIIDDLKELYEMQQETRETELEYQENLLENSNYIAEANSLLQSWKTVDEMRDWMWAHTEDIDKMSDEAVEKLTEDWATMFDNIQVYNEISQREITSIFDVSAQEVQDIVLTTSETLTTEADRAFGEITNEVNEAIESARQAVTDAMNALADAQETYNEKIRELNETITQTALITQRLAEALNTAGANVNGVSQILNNYGPPAAATDAYNASNRDYDNWLSMDEIQRRAEGTALLGSGNRASIPSNIMGSIPSGTEPGQYLKHLYGSSFVYGGIGTPGEGWSEGYIYADEAAMNRHIMELSLERRAKFRRFKSGGLANYTGLAYVDGTTNKPEAFLSAEDTARVGEAADIFRQVARLGTNGTLNSALSNVSSETNSTVNIFVDSIATEEQVDYLINRMKEEQVKAANPIGASIILRQ